MGILTTDALVMDQVRSFLSSDFGIQDLGGQPIGRIVTEGSTASRMFMGNRQLAVVDGDNTLLLRVDDIVGIGLDRFTVTDGWGQPLAQIVKEFTFLKKSLRVELATGPVLRLEGSVFDREFTVTGPGGLAATASRSWPGVAQAFLGRERYVLGFVPQVPVPEKLGTIGAVLALDMIRAKQRNNG
jgi:uncharacterized protein YxjI